jgi:hypothetical protein
MLQLTIQAKSSAPLEGASPFMVFLTYFVADLNWQSVPHSYINLGPAYAEWLR